MVLIRTTLVAATVPAAWATGPILSIDHAPPLLRDPANARRSMAGLGASAGDGNEPGAGDGAAQPAGTARHNQTGVVFDCGNRRRSIFSPICRRI